MGAENQFTAAGDIVAKVLKSQGPLPGSYLPVQTNLKRVINLARAKDRPERPKRDDPNFKLNTDFFTKAFPEKFFVGEVACGEERHLIFASKTHSSLVRRWHLQDCRRSFLPVIHYQRNAEKQSRYVSFGYLTESCKQRFAIR